MKKIVSYKRMIDQHAEESTNSNRNSFSLWNGRKGKILNSWFVYALCVSSDPHTDNSVLTESADWWKAGCRGKIYLHHLFFTVNLCLCQSAVARVRIRAYASCKKSLYCDLISFADSVDACVYSRSLRRLQHFFFDEFQFMLAHRAIDSYL